MPVERCDKRTIRQSDPRRVGAGLVALLALGAGGAGCGQPFLRPKDGAALATESLGQADTAIPSRKIAWVGSDGRREIASAGSYPSREPERLNEGLASNLVASDSTWNGWKVPASKKETEFAASPSPRDPVVVAAPIELAESPKPARSQASIPLPAFKRGSDDAGVEALLAASRASRIAPPLNHPVVKPSSPQVVSAPFVTKSTETNELTTLPKAALDLEKVERESSTAKASFIEGPAVASVEKITSSESSSRSISALTDVAETKPETIPQAPVETVASTPSVAPVTIPLEVIEKVTELTSTLENSAGSVPLSSPIPPPSDVAETTAIPAPGQAIEVLPSPVLMTATAPPAPVEAPMAVDPPATQIPMPVPIQVPVTATVVAEQPATDIPMPVPPSQASITMQTPPEPTVTKIPMPVSIPSSQGDPVELASRSTNIPMPVPVAMKAEDPVVAAPRTTNIPMPVSVTRLAEDHVVAASRTTNIPMPVSVTRLAEDPGAAASRTTNIPLPVPVAMPAGDPVMAVSRSTNIPMPVTRPAPVAVDDPLAAASRSAQIPLPSYPATRH